MAGGAVDVYKRQAYDGAEALKLVEEKKPDLIILDLMMPQISGIEVCREVRKLSLIHI